MAIRVNLLILAGLVLAVCGLCTLGCKKEAEKGQAKLDPHSPEGIMVAMHDQAKQLADAIERKDFKYIHDYGYYMNGFVVAFNAKLDDGARQRLRAPVKELLALVQQLDRAGGGRHAEAAEAIVKRIQVVLQELDQQYKQGKPPR